MKKVKIVKVLVLPAPPYSNGTYPAIYVICADGSCFWRNLGSTNDKWVRDDDLPLSDEELEE